MTWYLVLRAARWWAESMDPVRLAAVARKEWIQIRRDKRSLILAFVLPLFLLLFFGYAITWDVDDIRIAVLDQGRLLACGTAAELRAQVGAGAAVQLDAVFRSLVRTSDPVATARTILG